jgi:hypothetical protein
VRELGPCDGRGPGARRRRSLDELRGRLWQVGGAYGEVRKPRCRKRHNRSSETERPESI